MKKYLWRIGYTEYTFPNDSNLRSENKKEITLVTYYKHLKDIQFDQLENSQKIEHPFGVIYNSIEIGYAEYLGECEDWDV